MYRSNQSEALPSSKKTHSEKHKQILKQLLKEEGNRVCVDCKTSAHPRWASWNLGCFMCIRCSGIHRSMGVHISKVKSVDLDAWTDEQVESMVKWGNNKCNSYWEDKLPDGYVPDQSKIENFIRTKYDLKKWVSGPTIPDPMKLSGTASVPVVSPSKPVAAPVSASTPAVASAGKSLPKSGNLLDDDFGSFTSAAKPSVPSKPRSSTPSSTKSSPAVVSGNNNPLPSLPIKTSSQSSMASNTGRPDLKKSILSLYSSPSSSNSSFVQPQQQQTYQQQKQPDTQSLANSLQGLSFNTSASTSAPVPSPGYMGSSNSSRSTVNSAASSATASQPPARTNWNNEWSDLGSNQNSSSTWTAPGSTTGINSTGLDDDLFKNVWK